MSRTALSPPRSTHARSRGHLLLCLLAATCGLGLTGTQAATDSGAARTAAEPVRYVLTDLGHLGSDFSEASGINESGQVVGYSFVPNGPRRAFIWKPAVPNGTTGQMVSLGSLTGTGRSEARDINDRGQVVGLTEFGVGARFSAFLWNPTVPNGTSGRMSRLTATLPEGDVYYHTDAYAINQDGAVAGVSVQGAGSLPRAILWQNSGKSLLHATSPDDSAWANGINAAGLVAGWAERADGTSGAARWRNGGVTELGDLDVSDGGVAYDINDQGQVVGVASGRGVPLGSVAFLWEAGEMRSLGAEVLATSAAYGINNKGQVVGQSRGAVLWEDGRLINLNTLIPAGTGWDLQNAQDINEKGQIVGKGTSPSGLPHGFLLTPLPPARADVSVSAANTPSAARVGMDFTFTRNVRNSGPDSATEVNFLETLPAGVTFRSAQSTQGTLLQSGNLVAFQLGTLAKLGTATITITIRYNATGLIKLNAEVGGLESDPNESNNFAEQSLTVGRGVANLGLVLTAEPLPVKVGGNLEYTLTVTNHGPAQARGVTLTNTLPPGADFVSASSGAGKFVRSGNIITFTFPVMEVSHEDDFPPDKWDAIATVVVRTKTVGTLRYSAQVRAALSDEPSPDPHPNSASVDATVSPLAGPDLTGEWGEIKYTNIKKKKKRVSKLSGAFTIRNAGNLPSGATLLRFYLSDDQTLDDGDRFAYQLAVPALEAGVTWTNQKRKRGEVVQVPTTFSFDVPRGTGGGSPFMGKFAILVIAPSAVAELNANNNVDVSAPLP